MTRTHLLTCLLAGLAVLLLAACSSNGAAEGADPAAQAVEGYLTALVDENADQLATASCAAWEEQATLELDSFMGVEASLQDLACQTTGDADGSSLVQCTGKIVATYNNEQQELDLAGRTYQVSQEEGEWRVCGYH
ncbi:MAG: hypothetical protein GYA17_11800 [Chloroflexi bacterium]|jgi:hypothetical protein|nr:hypothetical protein [Chloroflexota bacterium]